MSDKPSTDDAFIKALEVATIHERVIFSILTLAVEYEAKTITPDRFAERVVQMLKSNYDKFTKA